MKYTMAFSLSALQRAESNATAIEDAFDWLIASGYVHSANAGIYLPTKIPSETKWLNDKTTGPVGFKSRWPSSKQSACYMQIWQQ